MILKAIDRPIDADFRVGFSFPGFARERISEAGASGHKARGPTGQADATHGVGSALLRGLHGCTLTKCYA